MKQNISHLLKEALKLPPEARAALAGTLLDSLDQTIGGLLVPVFSGIAFSFQIINS